MLDVIPYTPLEVLVVIVEFLRPVLGAIAVVAVADIVLLGLSAAGIGGSLRGLGWALGSALGVGAVVFAVALALLPAASGGSWGSIQGTTDLFAVTAGALGLGLGAAAAVFPPLQFILGMGAAGQRGRHGQRRQA